MPGSIAAGLKGLVLGLAASVALLIPSSAAQEIPPPDDTTQGPPAPAPRDDASTPPELGTVVFADGLTGPGLVHAFGCPTQRSSRGFVAEGFLMSITGKCFETQSLPNVSQVLHGLSVPDGELRLDVRFASGPDRVRLRLGVRTQPDPSNSVGYAVQFEPGGGAARFIKTVGPASGLTSVLAERTDLAGLLVPDGWNSLAVRSRGSSFWVLLNDQPILSATDATFDTGRAMVALVRLGDPNDTQEAAAVLRNLRASALASGEAVRAPTYTQPGPPRIGRFYFSLDPDGTRRAQTHHDVITAVGVPTYVFFDYYDVFPPNALKTYWLVNDASDRVSGSPAPPFVPASATGFMRRSFNTHPSNSGSKLTLVVELNGQEAARGSVLIQ